MTTNEQKLQQQIEELQSAMIAVQTTLETLDDGYQNLKVKVDLHHRALFGDPALGQQGLLSEFSSTSKRLNRYLDDREKRVFFWNSIRLGWKELGTYIGVGMGIWKAVELLFF